MIRPIVKYGDPVLARRAEPVGEITPEIQTLIDDMIETMYAAPGIGLAAPQVGVSLRLCVIDITGGRRGGEVITLINPEFVERTGMQLEEEGCLSVPGHNATVARPERAVVAGLNREGQPVTIDGTGLLARALQHELDHLDGTLFVDRLRGLRRDLILRKVRKQQRAGTW
ncbi:MAG: peptide deformylase [Acidobacteria bacterium]|nr:peptide deformylase [Acidobacteriota bacterium]